MTSSRPPGFDFQSHPLEMKYRPNTVPFMAVQVATVRDGKYAGTEVLMGMGGPQIYVVIDGVAYGAVGCSYGEFATRVINAFERDLLGRDAGSGI